MKNKVRALGLLSGGLDSILAVKVIQRQGIEVTGISFSTPFFGPQKARQAAEMLGIPLMVEDITEKHFEMVKNPPHGYGKTMNPCIDCHAMMINYAGKIMEEKGFDFIFTGEVLGERPMSQNRQSLDLVSRLSGYGNMLLRPLSALLLEPTKPEISGLVDRSCLLNISGRSRKPQIILAEEFNVREYPNPSGGCLLTDKSFSIRLKELLSCDENPSARDLNLLRYGRQFRLSKTAKLIVGRDMRENEILEKFFQVNDVMIYPGKVPGPVCLLAGQGAEDAVEEAARICAAFSDTQGVPECSITACVQGKDREFIVNVDRRNRELLRI